MSTTNSQYKKLAKRIADMAKDKGVSLSNWSKKSGLSSNYLSNLLFAIKSGKPHRPDFTALAKGINTNASWLENGGTESKHIKHTKANSAPVKSVRNGKSFKSGIDRFNWLTSDEAAKLLGVTKNRVYQLDHERRITSAIIKDGTKLYLRSALIKHKNEPKRNPGDFSPRNGKPKVETEQDQLGNRWINVEAAAKLLKCSNRNVQRLTKAGKIISRPAKNDKRSLVYSEASINIYLNTALGTNELKKTNGATKSTATKADRAPSHSQDTFRAIFDREMDVCKRKQSNLEDKMKLVQAQIKVLNEIDNLCERLNEVKTQWKLD